MFLYHHVPEQQTGDIIFPLNQLNEKLPALYDKQKAKYDDIKEKDVEIPGFGYWNDCVNLMPVNPGLVKKELQKYGHDTNWPWRFYKIDADKLDNSKLIIMVISDTEKGPQREFIKFSKAAFDKHCHIGEVTRSRFQEAKENGEQPNTFAGVPHVLYKGAIDVDGLEVVEF